MTGTRDSAVVLAAFLGSFVECVEALTIVLAVGTTRGWRSALSGVAMGMALLVGLVIVSGHLIERISITVLQLVIGVLVLIFGLRWLQKAVFRAAGIIPLHDETAIYAREQDDMRRDARRSVITRRWTLDTVAVLTTFKAVTFEGVEVVFIVAAAGAGGMLWPASIGAALATVVVSAIGVVLHRPLARVPENTLKLTVGILLSAFGIFWLGEGLGLHWIGGDAALLVLMAVFLILTGIAIRMLRWRRRRVGV